MAVKGCPNGNECPHIEMVPRPLIERLFIAFIVSIFVVSKPLAKSFGEMTNADSYSQLDFATLTFWSPLVAIILTCYHAYRHPMHHFWDQVITAAGLPAVILAFLVGASY